MSSSNKLVTVITFTDKIIDLWVNLESTNVESILDTLAKDYEYKCSEPFELIDFKNLDTNELLKSRYQYFTDIGINTDCKLKMCINHMSKTKNCYPSNYLVEESKNSKDQIFVKGLDGKTNVIGITNSMTILDIKKLLTCRTDFPHYAFNLVRFSRNRTRLDEDRTVGDYMIDKGESFDMILKLRGGHIKENIKLESNEIQQYV